MLLYSGIANSQAVLKLTIAAFHHYMATPKSILLHFLIYLIFKNVKRKVFLNLKYELNVSHETSSTLEVCFSVGSAKSFMPTNYLAKLGKRAEEESLVIKF